LKFDSIFAGNNLVTLSIPEL